MTALQNLLKNTQCTEVKTDPYLIQNDNPDNISHEQREGVSCTGTEALSMNGAHNVSVLIDKLEETFETPKAALAEAHQASSEGIVEFLQLVVDVL